MYDKCYFCLDQLPKLKKESTASFFVNFGRSRGTKEPTYITVIDEILSHSEERYKCNIQQCSIVTSLCCNLISSMQTCDCFSACHPAL